MDDGELDRRAAMSSALGLLVGGCATCGDLEPLRTSAEPRLRVGDAHAHFFNAADLPIVGFFRNVLVPSRLANWPEVALAFIDLAARVLKALTIPASSELRRMRAPWQDGEDPTADAFAAAVDVRAREVVIAAGPTARLTFDPRTDLGDSYRFLADVINASAAAPSAAGLAADGLFNRTALAAVAKAGDAANAGTAAQLDGRSVGDILQLVAWAFRMTHSRCSHVRRYLNTMEAEGTAIDLVVNLLVDYDFWLADAPKAGSDQARQVEFWTRYARAASKRIQIATFAGYDPLRHAVQREGGPDYFAELKGWATASAAADRRVAGFKLYPPMGFTATQNPAWPMPLQRSAANAAQLWAEAGRPINALPAALDAALLTFFRFAMENDVPLLAHAANSNAAFPGAGAYAHPQYWRALVENMEPLPAGHSPLRICLAHYEKGFISGGELGRLLDLNQGGRAKIWFDIAFEETVLQRPNGAGELLDRLALICLDRPLATQYFMFGTDWIMLDQLVGSSRYLPLLDAAITAHDFWRIHREALLGGNLRRFLKLDAANRVPL